jgi:hypothetical protein
MDDELRGEIARVAVAALVDSLARVESDRKNVRVLTVEIELNNGRPVTGRSWVERGIDAIIGSSSRLGAVHGTRAKDGE